jgi:2-keto-4-pentenoate hydratase/2-oxohepta-3-ene-1,7-dioic acid hydratase in catechol pathway
MATSVIRFQIKNAEREPAPWGVQFGNRVAPLAGSYATTADFVRFGLAEAKAAQPDHATLALSDLRILPPVTPNQQFVCQGVNYTSHLRESGMDPGDVPFNMLFTKSPHCITGAYDDVVRPRHVRLLDYEIELGLVMKTDLSSKREFTPDTLHEVLAGITIVNDVSARDVQLPQGQFYKGKSYRGFGPVGPALLLLEEDEWRLLPALRMTLSVNGQTRQDDLCSSMIHKPHQTLSELSGLHDMAAGDLIATGTPAGCAAKAPGKAAMFVARHFLSDKTKWHMFVRNGLKNPKYLQPDDVMELCIRTDDGRLDLGVQRTRVVGE